VTFYPSMTAWIIVKLKQRREFTANYFLRKENWMVSLMVEEKAREKAKEREKERARLRSIWMTFRPAGISNRHKA